MALAMKFLASWRNMGKLSGSGTSQVANQVEGWSRLSLSSIAADAVRGQRRTLPDPEQTLANRNQESGHLRIVSNLSKSLNEFSASLWCCCCGWGFFPGGFVEGSALVSLPSPPLTPSITAPCSGDAGARSSEDSGSTVSRRSTTGAGASATANQHGCSARGLALDHGAGLWHWIYITPHLPPPPNPLVFTRGLALYRGTGHMFSPTSTPHPIPYYDRQLASSIRAWKHRM